MKEKLIETIEQMQKKLEQIKEWQVPYDTQVNIMLEHREMLKQFYKTCKQYEYVQFHIVEISPSTPHLFKIEIRYWGQPIATITLSKDRAIITTEQYNNTNKKIFNCSIQLKEVEWNTKDTIKFMDYFNKPDVPINSKINETSKTESMLLAEFSKNSSETKLLIRYSTYQTRKHILFNSCHR